MWCFILLCRCRQWTRFRFSFFFFLEIQKDGIQFAACNKRTLNTIAKVTIFCVIEHSYPFFCFSFLDRAGERKRSNESRSKYWRMEDEKKRKSKQSQSDRIGSSKAWRIYGVRNLNWKQQKNNRFQQYILLPSNVLSCSLFVVNLNVYQ